MIESRWMRVAARLASAATLAGVLMIGAGLAPAAAASCGNDAGGFPAWREDFKAEAIAAGIAPQVAALLDGATYNTQVIRLDRTQKSTFKVSFEEFIANRVTAGRIAKGRKMMAAYAGVLANVRQRFGVQPEMLVAIWGMETDYGVVTGKMSVIRSLATLAYDCRRSAFFTDQLMSALQIVQRGDKTAAELVGAWAGEIGQTQFLATNYLLYAVDQDGDGRRNLISSPADVLASTANLLKSHGWKPGAGYQPGEPNFPVLASWNKSANYQRALALFAAKLVE